MTDEPKTQVPARRFRRRRTRSSSVIGRPRSLDRTRYTEGQVSLGGNEMPLSARALLLLQLLTVASPALAHGPPDVDRAARAITRALPGGWSIVEEKDQEIPYGHHWCDNYAGSRGMKLVVLGVKDVNLHLQDHDGNWYRRWLGLGVSVQDQRTRPPNPRSCSWDRCSPSSATRQLWH